MPSVTTSIHFARPGYDSHSPNKHLPDIRALLQSAVLMLFVSVQSTAVCRVHRQREVSCILCAKLATGKESSSPATCNLQPASCILPRREDGHAIFRSRRFRQSGEAGQPPARQLLVDRPPKGNGSTEGTKKRGEKHGENRRQAHHIGEQSMVPYRAIMASCRSKRLVLAQFLFRTSWLIISKKGLLVRCSNESLQS